MGSLALVKDALGFHGAPHAKEASSRGRPLPRGPAHRYFVSPGGLFALDLGTNVTAAVAGDGTSGYIDGPSASARFHTPSDVAVDANGGGSCPSIVDRSLVHACRTCMPAVLAFPVPALASHHTLHITQLLSPRRPLGGGLRQPRAPPHQHGVGGAWKLTWKCLTIRSSLQVAPLTCSPSLAYPHMAPLRWCPRPRAASGTT
jgi:hypothetical protein